MRGIQERLRFPAIVRILATVTTLISLSRDFTRVRPNPRELYRDFIYQFLHNHGRRASGGVVFEKATNALLVIASAISAVRSRNNYCSGNVNTFLWCLEPSRRKKHTYRWCCWMICANTHNELATVRIKVSCE